MDFNDSPLRCPPSSLLTCQVVTIARSLGRLQRDHGLPVDPEENVNLNLNFGLVDVVYEWARGVPFREITQVLTRKDFYFELFSKRLLSCGGCETT